MDRAKVIFGNEMSDKAYRKAVAAKNRFIRKYGDDSGKHYHLTAVPAPAIGDILGTEQLLISDRR